MRPKSLPISRTQPLPPDLFRKFTPNSLTSVELDPVPGRFPNWVEPGFYYGDALDPTDLVNFWNLRACDIEFFITTPTREPRLRPLVESYAKLLHERPKRTQSPSDINVWQKDRDCSRDLGIFGSGLSLCTFDAGLFNGLNLNPPFMTFPEHSVLGAYAQEDSLGTSVTFLLPEKPFFSDADLHSQMMVVSVSGPNLGNAMLTPPFIASSQRVLWPEHIFPV